MYSTILHCIEASRGLRLSVESLESCKIRRETLFDVFDAIRAMIIEFVGQNHANFETSSFVEDKVQNFLALFWRHVSSVV
jgi:hypothetical protein